MLTGRIKIQIIVFVVISLMTTTYLGIKYVGINLFGSGYEVTATLPDAGGIFTNGEVTYRGVPVGRIKHLEATKDGLEAVLHIDDTAASIPADATVSVANRSAIGEQYIDLAGTNVNGKVLANGDRIHGTAASLPPAIDGLLRTARDFTESVPQGSLKTVIDESYDASRGAGAKLARLLDTSQQFVESADKNFLVTAGLIQNSSTVLATQQESAASIMSFSSDLNLLAATLSDSDGDLRTLIDNSPAAAREIYRLFDQVGTPLGILMSNLVSTAQIFGTNSAGIEDAFIRIPGAVSVGWAVNGSGGMNLGLAQTYFDPLPCTSGYGGTQLRRGLDTTPGAPFNTNAGCTVSPASGTNVRGPKSVAAAATSAAAARVSVASSMADLMGGAQ